MTAPDLPALTASLERSLQNCSLNQPTGSGSSPAPGAGIGRSSSSDSPDHHPAAAAALDLRSDVSLPYHWEQCLDLETGEIYYINWRTGMKVKEDPRAAEAEEHGGDGSHSGGYNSEEEDDDDEGSSSYESEESSSESSPAASSSAAAAAGDETPKDQSVLVVAGCKSCLMYYMVPRKVQECPKCSGQLLHFDRSENP